MTETINVLDKGYVRLVDVMGNDLSAVNSARVSYDKESTEMTERDAKLLNFLAREGHTSPFRHAFLSFEVYAPLMVARQWWKYIVASDHVMDGWNESSRRYITEDPTFHVPNPDEWRKKPANSKQGSGGYFKAEEVGTAYTAELERFIQHAEAIYGRALGIGIAPEQARLFLPAYGMYVRWRWSASLQSVAHLISQRIAHDAQKEFQDYAKAVYKLSKPHFAESISKLTGVDEIE